MGKKFISKNILIILFFIITASLVLACDRDSQSHQTKLESNGVAVSGETKVVNHFFGKIKIPANPQRIVVLDDHVILDPILSLDVKPVGILSINDFQGETLRGIPDRFVRDIAEVGIAGQPSLERILSLKPDLIIANEFHKQNYEKLSAIAPTILNDYSEMTDFKQRLRYYAQVLGKQDRAEDLLRQYQARIEQLQQALGSKLNSIEVSVIYLFGSGNSLGIYQPDLLTHSQILQDVGLQLTQADQKEIELKIGIESLPKYDADYLFVITGHAHSASSFLQQPIWSTLEAVKNNRVYEVQWDVGGPIGANRIINDLYKYLLDRPSSSLSNFTSFFTKRKSNEEQLYTNTLQTTHETQ